MRSRLLPLLVVLGAVAAAPAGAAQAQIVNVQPLVGKAEEPGLSGEIGGSLTLKTGNVELFLVSGSALAFYRAGEHTLISSSSVDMGWKGGVDDEDKFLESLFSHLRWQVELGPTWTWETYAQVASDEFKRLAFRGLAGAGPRLTLLDGPDVSAAVAVSYMFEREALNEGDLADSEDTENNHRMSSYLTATISLAPHLSVVHTTYYQPLLTDFSGDFRVSSDTSLSVGVSETLSIAVTFNVAYDSAPPIGVEGTDTNTNVSLNVAF
ncbi:MAG: DUF481 domain-containing protein [Myxococcota bacterium]